jgi:thiamine-monophosphate kinase
MSRQYLSQLGEFGWLKKLLPRLYWPSQHNSQLCIGPGDDAGVMRITPGRFLVATTDTLVEGIHFERKWFSPRDLGEKLLAVNISDLAAMGDVKPLAALITVSLPGDTPVDYVDKFYKGLLTCAQRWKIGFLGGDTVGSKRAITVSATLLGEANPKGLVRRGGALKGDVIGVIGPLGLAAAGLEILQTGKGSAAGLGPLLKAFCRPEPQVKAGALLARNGWVSSMMDASDGLEASLRLLAEASHLGIKLDLSRFTVVPALKRWAQSRGKDPLTYVLRGGEDYALVFTAAPARWQALKRRFPQAQLIGTMVGARKGMPLKSYGYDHF